MQVVDLVLTNKTVKLNSRYHCMCCIGCVDRCV